MYFVIFVYLIVCYLNLCSSIIGFKKYNLLFNCFFQNACFHLKRKSEWVTSLYAKSKELFMSHPSPHPVLILKDVEYEDLRAVIDFMYYGEVHVAQDRLDSVVQVSSLGLLRKKEPSLPITWLIPRRSDPRKAHSDNSVFNKTD